MPKLTVIDNHPTNPNPMALRTKQVVVTLHLRVPYRTRKAQIREALQHSIKNSNTIQLYRDRIEVFMP